MKTEHLCRIMAPLNLNEMRYETGLYITQYNEHRPLSSGSELNFVCSQCRKACFRNLSSRQKNSYKKN